MKKKQVYENPLRFLKRKTNGEFFEDTIVKQWYLARNYVKDVIQIEKYVFKPEDDDFLHIIADGDAPCQLFVVRQIALLAHFLNYNENNPIESHRHRTVISLFSSNKNIKNVLEQEEYLYNLTKYCKYSEVDSKTKNPGSYVDIEVNVVNDESQIEVFSQNTIYVKKTEVEDYFEQNKDKKDLCLIETSAAYYAGKVYDIGAAYTNIPAEDIHCVERYTLALSIFQNDVLKLENEKEFNEGKYQKAQTGEFSLGEIKKSISNVLCADCFKIRQKSIEKVVGKENVSQKEWAKYNEPLSKSEHARWIVEKLILGYRPLSREEHFQLESLHVEFKNTDKKKAYLDNLKNNDKDPAHIDLCSYAELRRIKPEDLKYDSFLMLAIPSILNKVK